MTRARDETASELFPLLRVLRRRGNEVQLTQVIRAVATQDPAFAAGFVRAIIALSRRDDAPAVPAALGCRAEQSLTDVEGSSTGRGDLLFEDEDGSFSLLVELKLRSGYGVRQLERYLRSLDALAGETAWLIAVTTHLPHHGERAAAGNPQWLGSVRWADVYQQLVALSDDLAIRKPSLADAWRATLAVAREQGDFGPMDFDPKLLVAWAQRDDAERALSQILRQLIQPTSEMLRIAVNADPDDEDAAAVRLKGQSQPVYVSKKRVLVRFDVRGHERFWIQFYARPDGTAVFTAEARHQGPKSQLSPSVDAMTDAGVALELEHGRDEFGHSWKLRAIPANKLPCGADVRDELQRHIKSMIDRCGQARIFDVLASEHPSQLGVMELLDESE